uniref:(California timema) hypothetical protein n=1 Tax=Timema californicum TaxID=61474 RepID=A0A7R9P7U4_TIMCA|nr:unnamed protein product [Timema californicum]
MRRPHVPLQIPAIICHVDIPIPSKFLCIHKRLLKCANKSKGLEELYSLAISKFDIPGEAGFPLNSVYAKPSNPAEADLMRQYLSQIRQATGARLCDKVYATEDGRPSKWWLCFARKKFMDKSLSGPGY